VFLLFISVKKIGETRIRNGKRAPEVAMDAECRSRLQQDSTLFFRNQIRSQIYEKPDPESLFNFGSSRSLRGLS